ncbi:MAG: transcriptional regulator [Alphaproteobacteria bacterium RIFOXYD12_FULL_60_8]|nr:MAG: transcriptional regulator [Alphaproteobacteria bacterium RIFOXYD12_FULL_60_8]
MDQPIAARIKSKLTEAFAPHRLTILDQSDRHAGHAGAHPLGESHFRVEMCSAAFTGISRVERQRRVMAVLAEEMAERVHALSLSITTPEED